MNRHSSFVEVLDRNAAERPGGEALRCEGQSLSWGELRSRATAVAAWLLENGFETGDRAGVCLEKSIEMMVGLYGIWMAGGAWVPLDSTAPAARRAAVLRDCGVEFLISRPADARLVCELFAEGIQLRGIVGAEQAPEAGIATIGWKDLPFAGAPQRHPLPEDLAYIIYTSGSTGVPKGIAHTHASGLAYCESTADLFEVVPEDRISNQAPLHFDIAIFDLFSAAVGGATTVLIPAAYLKLPASLARLLEEERITIFFTVPFALLLLQERGALEERDLSRLRTVIFGGEIMSPQPLRFWQRLLPSARFHNMYGPAEVNGCTGYDVPDLSDDDSPIPIGKAYATATGKVNAAEGEAGELLISGPTCMRGYWNRPALDAIAFVESEGRRWYRTGDLVRLDPDGNYLFLGRADRQVKVRGYRIELDEVEAVLRRQPGVVDAAVFAAGDGMERRVHAALKLSEGYDLLEIRRLVGAEIPIYAKPRAWEAVEEFPRISSGKVDYISLQKRAGVRPA